MQTHLTSQCENDFSPRVSVKLPKLTRHEFTDGSSKSNFPIFYFHIHPPYQNAKIESAIFHISQWEILRSLNFIIQFHINSPLNGNIRRTNSFCIYSTYVDVSISVKKMGIKYAQKSCRERFEDKKIKIGDKNAPPQREEN